jgi:streptogramin lyase
MNSWLIVLVLLLVVTASPARRSFPHTVRIDKDDNIWTVDKGADMIVRFSRPGA